MDTMRDSWTDARLDDLNHRVDDGFNRVDADLRAVRSEIGTMRSEMNARLDSLQRTMLQTSGVMIAALIGLIATQL